MKLYENSKSTKSKNLCSYCRGSDHNITDCPQVAKDWYYWADFKVPPHDGYSWKSRRHPKYWGEWYTKCRDAYVKQQAKKQKASTPVVRAAPKCGFCGSHLHNRRNCTKMAAFIAQCKKANYNYRQLFHDTFVKQYGIDVGAAISVRKEHWSDEVQTFIGLITKINLDKINVFTEFDYGWDVNEKYGQPIEVQALVDGNETWINISTFCRDNAALKPLVKRQSSHYSRLVLTKVIGKSETPLPDDWVTSYDDAWDFLAKKRSYEKLKEDGVVAHIEEWANMR